MTPNSGGISIFLSFMIGLLLLGLNIKIGILISLIFIFIVGLYDDYFGSTSKQKIIFLFITGNILFFSGFHLDHLGTFFGNDIMISGVFAYLFLLFVIIGFVNSLNLIDGLDGLASIIGIIILSTFAYVGIKYEDEFLTSISLIYIFSILGYLYFNYSPAKIFMGDSGSLSIGLVITIVAIHSVNMEYITPISILMLAALPILDTLIVMIRRIKSGLNPFTADKLHIHHIILKQQKMNTQRTVIILGLIQIMFSYIGLGFKIKDDSLILILFIIFLLIFYMLLSTVKVKKLK